MDLKQFDKMLWCKPDWSSFSISDEDKELVKQYVKTLEIEIFDDVEEIIRLSNSYPIPFPIDTVRLKSLKLQRPLQRLQNNILSTYPIVHEKVLLLMAHFLKHKRLYGNSIEKDLYKNMSVPNLINRILRKRAVTFMCAYDKYQLLSGKQGREGWESVGTMEQKPPLVLEDCLSYDEMKLAALVYVSGHTECINDGERRNCGVFRDDDIEHNAVIIGLVGPRFTRKSRMDYEDMVISAEQNCVANGYGVGTDDSDHSSKKMWRQLWFEFYEATNYTYDDLISSVNLSDSKKTPYVERYVKLSKQNVVFDNEIYYKRICILLECTLMEAEHRAKTAGKNAFLNIIGCGLGVWKISAHQADVYILICLERIKNFLEKNLINHISDVSLSYMKTSKQISALFSNPEGRIFFEHSGHPNGGVNVILQNREPSAKLTGEHAGKLLVMTYPWDGNAHPGNEFWIGKLKSSGDSAAAASTQVSELHNAYINPAVCGNNTRVVGSRGVISLSDYYTALETSS